MNKKYQAIKVACELLKGAGVQFLLINDVTPAICNGTDDEIIASITASNSYNDSLMKANIDALAMTVATTGKEASKISNEILNTIKSHGYRTAAS